jgi:hypothetical protein
VERSIPAGAVHEDAPTRRTSGRSAAFATPELPAVPQLPAVPEGSNGSNVSPEDDGADEAEGSGGFRFGRLESALTGLALAGISFLAYYLIHPDRANLYTHFVLQAQAWLDGGTAIPMPNYQDVMPILDKLGQATGQGIIPFPPLPAVVLLPFVAIWHQATNQQLISTVFGGVDVAIAYWMLGHLPVRRAVRILTSVFLGLGTVLWYTAAIGSTWFWAHIVAVACLLLAVGLALAADREAAEPAPLSQIRGAFAIRRLPGGWPALCLLVGLGALGELMLFLAGAGTPPTATPAGLVESAAATPAATIALLGACAALGAVALALVVAGKPGAVAPFLVAAAIAGGGPAVLVAAFLAPSWLIVADVALLLAVLALLFGNRPGGRLERAFSAMGAALRSPEGLQIAAGILFGLAVTARLTILFGFPFLLLVGGGGSWLRRGLLAGAGALVPLVTLLVVTYSTSGFLFNPAYEYQYEKEASGYGSVLNYHPDWSITDLRYVPQNLGIMLFGTPEIDPPTVGVFGPDSSGTPACTTTSVRGIFDVNCPLAMPNAVGTGILISSPAFLLMPVAWWPLRRRRIDRVTVGATIAVVAIAFVNLMHFSQGWVQFGYRFSNDFVPFALLLVALGVARLGRLWPAVALVALSILINFWGTMWGGILGW